MTSRECKLPNIDPYFARTGKGTAYIGSMIKDAMTEYARDAVAENQQFVLYGYVCRQHGEYLFVRDYDGDPTESDPGGYTWTPVYVPVEAGRD